MKLVTGTLQFSDRYSGTSAQRGKVRLQAGILISRFVDAARLCTPVRSTSRRVQIDEEEELNVALLKELTWRYVILNPGLTTQQHGQRRVISALFHMLHKAGRRGDLDLFPFALRDEFARADAPTASRIVCDYIASMTERQALQLYRKMTGIMPGSALDN